MKTINTYYQNKLVTVRNSVKEDCFSIAKYMRKQDIEEAWITNNFSPSETALGCFQLSSFSFTLDRNGFPVAMFGLIPENMVGKKAMIWLLCTDGIKGIENTFIRNSRKFIDLMLGYYPELYSHVYIENKLSIKWLKFIGMKLGVSFPYGIEDKTFHYVYIKKGK